MVILLAIPMFLLFLAVEAISYKYRPDDDEVGYELRDTGTSLSMGIGSRVWGLLWDVLGLAVFTAIALATPLHIEMTSVWAWVALFLAEDLCYYVFHRVSHRCRFFWASHVVHHSSQHYNFSTALRQSWTSAFSFLFWIPLVAVGFPVWAVYLQQSISLLYQFFLHTERVHRLWTPIEYVMNTPSHHRVHHGVDKQYLDKNYAGILIVWDRLFGTFEPEAVHPTYGITKQLTTFNPFRVAYHEWYAIGHDVRHATGLGARFKHVFAPPGWAPATATVTP